MGNDDEQVLPRWASSITEKVATALLIGALVAMFGAIFAIDHLRSEIDGLVKRHESITKRLDGKRATISHLTIQYAKLATRFETTSDRIDSLENFKNDGPRFTRDDGDKLEGRIDEFEDWINKHEQFRIRSVLETNQRIDECLRRCGP